MIKLEDFKMKCLNDITSGNIKEGEMVFIKPTTQKLSIKDLKSLIIPDIKINKYFYYRKNIRLSKILHSTYEVEIIDKSLFNAELLRVENGKVLQYIDNDKIVTELEYTRKESDKEYYNRVLSDLENALHVFDHKHYDKRFFIDGMDDNDKLLYTEIIIDNIKFMICEIDKLLKSLN